MFGAVLARLLAKGGEKKEVSDAEAGTTTGRAPDRRGGGDDKSGIFSLTNSWLYSNAEAGTTTGGAPDRRGGGDDLSLIHI